MGKRNEKPQGSMRKKLRQIMRNRMRLGVRIRHRELAGGFGRGG